MEYAYPPLDAREIQNVSAGESIIKRERRSLPRLVTKIDYGPELGTLPFVGGCAES